jgi:peptide/nickel transport system permease protein
VRRRLLLLLTPILLLLPELRVDPFRADLPCQWLHPLGTDALGRDGLLRLMHAASRSVGFASAVSLLALGGALPMALGEERFRGARSALRIVPPLLLLLSLAVALDGLGWMGLAFTLSALLALQAEPALRARLDPIRRAPVWSMARIQGAGMGHRLRVWAPWAYGEALPLLPSLWIAVLWDEGVLRLLGLGPPPTRDSLGLLLYEELPRLSTDGTMLGWASLVLVVALAAWSASKTPMEES